eukprot:TRINITY_DN3254_c0_g1_i4.p1 TRINITY_DN3254_c0_g1~~TRINITY_DN3254_c0_g1_i4.p1  ORF type:complete len:288 (+),score=58.04 TRINITY_DN3254_c0_g1_i4:42-866(+)
MAVKCFGRDVVKAAFDKGFTRLVYVTASYPCADKMTDVLMALQESKMVDIVEVGIPFTDPVGDGPVIEECGLHALNEKCTSIFTVIELLRKARESGFTLPVIFMGYYNTFLTGWIEAAKDLVSGVIIVDLPFEEPHTHEVIEQLRASDLSFVPLVTPFTSGERIKMISSVVDTFLYCTCVMGITGARASLDQYLKSDYQPTWKTIQENTGSARKILGFGVSNNAAVKAVQDLGASGLVVGSAMMKTVAQNKDLPSAELRPVLVKFLQTLFEGTR